MPSDRFFILVCLIFWDVFKLLPANEGSQNCMFKNKCLWTVNFPRAVCIAQLTDYWFLTWRESTYIILICSIVSGKWCSSLHHKDGHFVKSFQFYSGTGCNTKQIESRSFNQATTCRKIHLLALTESSNMLGQLRSK